MCSLYVRGCGGWALFVGGVGVLVVVDELDVPKALCLLCVLKAVEGGLCLLEVLEILEVLEVLEMSKVMRCVLSVCWKLRSVGLQFSRPPLCC